MGTEEGSGWEVPRRRPVDGRPAGPDARALAALFPGTVAVHALAFGDVPQAQDSWPDELTGASARRLAEFQAGRRCAAVALHQLGCDGAGLLPVGARKAPIWPLGYCGSITHAHGVAAAVAGRLDEVGALGIDLDRQIAHQVVAELSGVIGLPSEQAVLQASGLAEAAAWSILFSAKESLYKAVAPQLGQYFDFLDARVVLAQEHSVSLALVRSLGPSFPSEMVFDVRYVQDGDWIMTGVFVPPEHGTLE